MTEQFCTPALSASIDSDPDYAIPEQNLQSEMEIARVLQNLADKLGENDRRLQPDIKPPTFSGLPGEDIEAFFQKFHRWAKLYINNDDDKLEFLPLFLHDKAYEAYSALSEDVKHRYDDLELALINSFTNNEFSILDGYKLTDLHMTPTDSVTSFYRKFNNQANRHDVQPNLRLSFFVKGLLPSIREFVLLQTPATIEEAYRLAKTKEVVSNSDSTSTTSGSECFGTSSSESAYTS